MNSDDEDHYIVYGTPLEREEEVASNKRKKQALDQGRLRVATSSSLEVLDENGRRRFHGAFTGGFSAGYYNTVGSKEGWVPQSFTSSRKKRAELAQQRPYDYMDDEEKAEQDSTRLATASDFDTFGFTAAELARKEAAQELKKRPSAIPGFVPDEIIVPVSRSIGYELLRKMGWRHGRSIGPKHIAASSDARKEGRKAMLAFAPCEQGESFKEEENANIFEELDPERQINSEGNSVLAYELPRSTPIYVINPKKDRYGFGFDPYSNAPEFRERRKDQEMLEDTKAPTRHKPTAFKSSLFRPNVGRMGSGFGIGALEELGEEDEDIYAPGIEVENVLSDEEAHAPSLKSQSQTTKAEVRHGVLPGFRPALHSGSKVDLFPPPIVPPDFDCKHTFKDSLEAEKVLVRSEPAEVAPPADMHLRKLIEGLAIFVARSGQKLESLYMEKRNNNPMFEFLSKGDGHDYYRRKLWEELRKDTKEVSQNNREPALDSVQRGQLLGEVPLQRRSMIASEDLARLQSALSSAFTKSASQQEASSVITQPFSSDPFKQARFEQYIKEKLQGGLRNVQIAGKSNLTEWERAQENLDFEAAFQNQQKQEASLSVEIAPSGLYQKELQAIINDRFSSQTLDKGPTGHCQEQAAENYPVRQEQPWRPRSLLCKRFNLTDPYAGKPPPVPKSRSRTEGFILLSNPPASIAKPSISPEHQCLADSVERDVTTHAIESFDDEDQVRTIVEKPVDLYKAIFSDESDEENAEYHEKAAVENASAEAAQAALNRLEAGDFLASMGKELGLKVPPPEFNHSRRDKNTFPHGESGDVLARQSAGTQTISETPQKLQQYYEPVSISDQSLKQGELRGQLSGKGGVSFDHYTVQKHINDSSTFTFEQSKQKAIATSYQVEKHLGNASKRGDKAQDISLKISSEESISDSSDDSQRNRHNRKRRKKERKHSKSEKRKSEKDHKRNKRHGENDHHVHKHHHRTSNHKDRRNSTSI